MINGISPAAQMHAGKCCCGSGGILPPARLQGLKHRTVLTVDRNQRRLALSSQLHDQRARHDQRFFVRQSNRLARFERRPGSCQASGANDRRDNDVDFGASDAPMSDAEVQKAGDAQHIPMVIGAVVVTYNIAGLAKPQAGRVTLFDAPVADFDLSAATLDAGGLVGQGAKARVRLSPGAQVP